MGIPLGKSLQLLRNENAVTVHPTCAIWAHLAHLFDQSDCKMTTSHTINHDKCPISTAKCHTCVYYYDTNPPSAQCMHILVKHI